MFTENAATLVGSAWGVGDDLHVRRRRRELTALCKAPLGKSFHTPLPVHSAPVTLQKIDALGLELGAGASVAI